MSLRTLGGNVLTAPVPAQRVQAVDPVNCACPTCTAGVSVALDDAGRRQVLQVLQGALKDNTLSYWEWRFEGDEVVVTTSSTLAEWRFSRFEADTFTVRNHRLARQRW